MNRRSFLEVSAVSLGLSFAPFNALRAATDDSGLRIAFQKSSPHFAIAKQKGVLEKRFGKVQWIEFPAGPQLLEALSVDGADIGMVGDSPAIFAQAAGKDLVYVGVEPPKPDASAVLVPKGSPILKIADLKGKRVGFQKGSSSHYLLVRTLEQSGLQYSDVTPAFLTPAEARAAFERGDLDAWVVWDPYYSAAIVHGVARALTTGREQGVNNNAFYLASKKFATQQPAKIAALFEELNRIDKFIHEQRPEAIKLYSQFSGLEHEVVALLLEHRPPIRIRPLSAVEIADQQRIADTYARLGLIPRQIRIQDIVWRADQTRERVASNQ